MSSYFPTWGAYDYSSWGIESVASSWLYEDYANPYTTPVTQTVVVEQPPADGAAAAAPVVAFDYSEPIGVTASPPEPAAVDSAQETLTAARERFRAGDYARALSLADQALASTPNDPILHEFRALVLFALKRYGEAAATAYAVLTAGPGWNWATMVGLYPDLDTYTSQLRELEDSVRSLGDAPQRFLLAYHYLVQGHKDAAAQQFQNVVKIQPNDELSARFASALGATTPPLPNLPPQLTAATGTGTAASNNGPPAPGINDAQSRPQGDVAAAADLPPPPAPPQNLQGQWTAKPNEKMSIILTLNPDGTFAWTVKQVGRSQTTQGQAGYQDQVLSLVQEQGPPLIGKIEIDAGSNRFTFKPPGAVDSAAGLSFEKMAVESR
jgi:tetratricopeptide (TPR) repeat protein